MIPELGEFAILLALAMAALQTVLPIVGAARGIPSWISAARPLAITQVLFVTFAYVSLTYSFIINDFSVMYIASHSNTSLPLIYRISGVWGGHEGSMLLWAMILAVWTIAVSLFSRSVPDHVIARVLGVMGFISFGILLFIIMTSSPFDRLIPAPMDGRDLNPLLQDIGMAIHPPLLYMGYVGFSVAFAFAIAAMLSGRMDTAWARWSRPWTTVAWAFLTIGIALGSWWAYYELGWGGWWFWDPVENASFMPWLVGTALIHSLAVTEKRSVFKAWTILLAVFAFSLSLLGTFLVRSGVLTSVHAFASDPARGVFILIFLALVVGISLSLYAWRAPRIRSVGMFSLFSRETFMLLNNIILVVTAASILLGTLYPLFMDALDQGKISVGPPYFNAVFIPLMVPLAILAGIGALTRWKSDNFVRLAQKTGLPLIVSIVAGLAIPALFLPEFKWGAALGVGVAIWVTYTTLLMFAGHAFSRGFKLARMKSVPLHIYGMSFAHIGVAVFTAGIALTVSYSVEKDVRMQIGDSYELSGYEFRFKAINDFIGPNFRAAQGDIEVYSDGKQVAHLLPQKRTYNVQKMPMTEAGIDAGLTRDLFVALGEPLPGNAWSVRLYVKPFLRWIWLGAIFMALGGVLAASDKRYRRAPAIAPARVKTSTDVKNAEGASA